MRLMEESSLPIAIVLIFSGINLTALMPLSFFSNTLKHGYLILMSQILTVASLEPLAMTFPSLWNTSRL